ncbi:electron transporter RnfD [Mucilaginibacter sp. BJC16-A38]|uniref:SGNH/GDSL hydrolase family protein n=1 Tax=Mucilaginibacter phenanthrenivorans TaxID=1234842 RepID=UPI0021584776|nr:SGNH/GDSL hydrolase family protein [Mucilaginibacter phenanthrenivorans]MCR8560591.1 electron transporter RnfD [Mucilaginibacter phenanthrenivorans]
MKTKFWICLVAILVSLNCVGQKIVKFNDPHIRYSGRIAILDTAAQLSWSANSIRINFTGTSVSATLKDERSDNNYNIIVDGKILSVFHPEAAKKEYVLASGLSAGKHTLEIFKRTEWAMGKTWFYQFKLDKGGKFLSAPTVGKHKIEYFGDSITCGYADEDTTGQDRGTSPFENGYLSYAALTARHYNAEFYSTSKSGIGITISWFPLVMSEMYDRLDATDPNSKWDFSKYTPDLVIINLFQNDSWLVKMPDNEQFKAKFGTTPPTPEFIINAYQSFVKSVRAKYPKAQILCILGSMDATKAGSPWPGYIEKAVAGLNDKKIYTHFIPYKNTNGHPSVKEQQLMANDLIAFIDKTISW